MGWERDPGGCWGSTLKLYLRGSFVTTLFKKPAQCERPLTSLMLVQEHTGPAWFLGEQQEPMVVSATSLPPPALGLKESRGGWF